MPTLGVEPGGPHVEVELLALALLPPAPNPARMGARITYILPAETVIRLAVLDVQGRVVDVVAYGIQAPGRHEVVWGNGGRVRAGVYFVRLEAGGRRFVQRALIIP